MRCLLVIAAVSNAQEVPLIARLPVDQLLKRLAGPQAPDVVRDLWGHMIGSRLSGGVWHHGNFRVGPEGMVRRQRLRALHIERRGRKMPVIQRRDQIFIDHMLPAPDIDDCGTFWQQGQITGV